MNLLSALEIGTPKLWIVALLFCISFNCTGCENDLQPSYPRKQADLNLNPKSQSTNAAISVKEIVIAGSDSDFSDLFVKSASILKFIDDDDKKKYSEKDRRLTDLIEAATEKVFSGEQREGRVFIEYDWWPDHTRHVEVNLDAFTQSYFDALRTLLGGEFAEWRIQVVIYSDLRDGHKLGSIIIWREKLLIDKSLYEALSARGIDFRCEAKPKKVHTDKVGR